MTRNNASIPLQARLGAHGIATVGGAHEWWRE
jgi:hypothetical protein